MTARKAAPVAEPIPPMEEPVIEEPIIEETPVVEEPVIEETPVIEEKPVSKPEVTPSPAINPVIEEKPAKKGKGLLIGVVVAVVGVIALGAAGAFLIPPLLNKDGGGETNSQGGGIFHSKPTNDKPVEKDPIGT